MKVETKAESIKQAWERLQPEECFFVPCLDELEAKKILMSMSSPKGKYLPVCKTGILRGKFGILCRRSTHPGRERPDIDRQLWFG